VVIEAYRHLVDDELDQPAEAAAALVVERKFCTCAVAVDTILDLRDAEAIDAVGLTSAQIRSEVGDWNPCWHVGAAAHQLGLHGILAHAATGVGETLALFTDTLPVEQTPEIVDSEIWRQLPADPRRLRAVDEDEGSSRSSA
jgi:hypothetical protein